MTLDRDKRQQIRDSHIGTCYGEPFPFCDQCGEELPCEVVRLVDRIEELEEALHTRQLRCEEREAQARIERRLGEFWWSRAKTYRRRYQGYRKAAIILRDLYRFENTFIVPRRG